MRTPRTAVILAAGRGTRLRPMTLDIPKCLIPVGGETLLARSVRLLRMVGVERIRIGTGHLSDRVEEAASALGCETFHNPWYADTGSLKTLSLAFPMDEDSFFLLESDLLYASAALEALVAHPDGNVMLSSGFTDSGDEVWVQTDGGRLSNLSKVRNDLDSVDGELVGIWKLTSDSVGQMMTRLGVELDRMEYEIALATWSSRRPITVCHIPDLVWCEIDDAEHLRRAVDQILPRLRR